MDRKEWKKLCLTNKMAAHYYYNIVREKLLSRDFESLENCDKDAKVIHHLRDTEEQRKYNDEHYELFGMNLDGTFEYGKYVVFWTKEHHTEYHKCSEETREKISKSNLLRYKNNPVSDETKQKRSTTLRKVFADENIRHKMSESAKASWNDERREQARINNTGKNNPMYGKTLSKEACDSKSSSMKAVWSDSNYKQMVSESMKQSWTDEKRLEYSKKFSGKNNPMCGEHAEDIKQKIKNTRILRKSLYNNYKTSGGELSYSEFRDYILPNLYIEE